MPRESRPEAALRLAQSTTSCPVPVAGAFFGLGVNGSYELARRGEFPVRVLRLGRKLRVPTADIVAALGLSDPPREAGEAGIAIPATATADPTVTKQESRDAEYPRPAA